jgi:hypothetical protein
MPSISISNIKNISGIKTLVCGYPVFSPTVLWINEISDGSYTWSNADNAKGEANGTYTSIWEGNQSGFVGYFNASAIPDSKTIKGVEMVLYLASDNDTPAYFTSISLGVGGPTPTWSASVAGVFPHWQQYLVVPPGAEHHNPHNYTYGNSTHLWGLTITPALLKAGCKVTLFPDDPNLENAFAYIDAVKLSIYWE